MNSLDDILALLCTAIRKNCGIDAYVVMPDDCPLPFARFSYIKTSQKTIHPTVYEAEIGISLFSEALNVSEASNLAANLLLSLEEIENIDTRIVGTQAVLIEVQQLKNSLITAETTAYIAYKI